MYFFGIIIREFCRREPHDCLGIDENEKITFFFLIVKKKLLQEF
jgi:hypothetical protein